MLENIKEKLAGILEKMKGKHLTEEYVEKVLREFRIALLEADVHYKTASEFINNVKEKAVGEKVLKSLTPYQQIIEILYNEFVSIMGQNAIELLPEKSKLSVIMIAGLQGSGKTTQTIKLGNYYKKKGYSVLLCSADVHRPAAIEQLRILSQKNSVDFFDEQSKNPVKIVKNAKNHALKNKYDMIIIDTAGRLHIDKEMMNEAKAIKKEVSPDEILLVIDSMTGQDAANIAKEFNETLEISGIILTKLDSDTKGGAALSVRHVSQKSIIFTSTGENVEAFDIFYPDRIANRILGLGDMMSLIEKAKDNYDEDIAQKQLEKMMKAEFDFNDYLEQMKQLKKMGSLESLLEMVPGMSNLKKMGNIPSEKDLKHIEAMILSMTMEERSKPEIINHSRRKRIAAGSGNAIFDVNRFIKNFEMTKKMMKKGSFKNIFKNFNM